MGSQIAAGPAAKFVRLEQALALVRPGNRVYLGTGCATPRSLLAGLEQLQPAPPDLELISFVTTARQRLGPTMGPRRPCRSEARQPLGFRAPARGDRAEPIGDNP